MRNNLRRLTSAALPLGLCFSPGFTSAAAAAESTVNASISVLEPMGVGHAGDLTIDAAARPRSGIRLQAATPGEYDLSGAHGQVFSVEATRDLRLSDGKGNVVSSKMRQSHTVGRHAGRTPASAQPDRVRIGGDVAVAANAPPGLYSGAFSVVVNYN